MMFYLEDFAKGNEFSPIDTIYWQKVATGSECSTGKEIQMEKKFKWKNCITGNKFSPEIMSNSKSFAIELRFPFKDATKR